MQRSLAIGMASAAVLAGCGEQTGQQYPELGQVRADIQYLQEPDVQNNANLSELNPARFNQVARFSIALAHGNHVGAIYSESPPSATVTRTAEFYRNVQQDLFDVAARYPTINMPLFTQADGRVTTVGKIKAALRMDQHPSAVMLTEGGAFTTYAESSSPGLPAGVTFKPSPASKLHETISFIGGAPSYFGDTIGLATEACQEALDVTTPNPADQITAQEVVCNTFGYAFGYADNRYSYQQYAMASDRNMHAMGTADGHFLRYMVLPPAAYDEIQAGQSPTDLAGIRDERNIPGS
jgi:hypothetical protein